MKADFKKFVFLLLNIYLAGCGFSAFASWAEDCPRISAAIGADKDQRSDRVDVTIGFMMRIPRAQVMTDPFSYLRNAVKVLKRSMPRTPEVIDKSDSKYLKFVADYRIELIKRGNALDLINKTYSEVPQLKNPAHNDLWRKLRTSIKETLSTLSMQTDPILRHWATDTLQGILNPHQHSVINLSDIDRSPEEPRTAESSNEEASIFTTRGGVRVWLSP